MQNQALRSQIYMDIIMDIVIFISHLKSLIIDSCPFALVLLARVIRGNGDVRVGERDLP